MSDSPTKYFLPDYSHDHALTGDPNDPGDVIFRMFLEDESNDKSQLDPNLFSSVRPMGLDEITMNSVTLALDSRNVQPNKTPYLIPTTEIINRTPNDLLDREVDRNLFETLSVTSGSSSDLSNMSNSDKNVPTFMNPKVKSSCFQPNETPTLSSNTENINPNFNMLETNSFLRPRGIPVNITPSNMGSGYGNMPRTTNGFPNNMFGMGSQSQRLPHDKYPLMTNQDSVSSSYNPANQFTLGRSNEVAINNNMNMEHQSLKRPPRVMDNNYPPGLTSKSQNRQKIRNTNANSNNLVGMERQRLDAPPGELGDNILKE